MTLDNIALQHEAEELAAHIQSLPPDDGAQWVVYLLEAMDDASLEYDDLLCLVAEGIAKRIMTGEW